jgi:hypothetical protein
MSAVLIGAGQGELFDSPCPLRLSANFACIVPAFLVSYLYRIYSAFKENYSDTLGRRYCENNRH